MVTTRSASGSAASDWDPAAKARTISHMNKDHSQDLSHILQHFNRLSATDAAEAQMVDIDASFITVNSRSGTHAVVLEPVLEWDTRRQRLIDLTMEARRALGIPTDDGEHGGSAPAKVAPTAAKGGNVVVTKYLPPVSHQWLVLLSVVFYFVNFAAFRAGYLSPGTLVWRLLDSTPIPGVPEVYTWLVENIFWPVVAIHVTECWWLDRTRLSQHGVARGGLLWMIWMASCFIEGLYTFERFDGEVARLRAEGKTRK